MEPLTNYNVIMIHGAADGQINGFECKDAKEEPYNISDEYSKKPKDNPWQIGNAPSMIGSYESSDKLTHWLDTKIFENTGLLKNRIDSTHIYLQRSFTKPAGSPRENGNEIGNAKWQCGERRSLIEEAQEIKAKGRDNLSSLRGNVKNRSQLPPSRNIIVAHSMGGVASREYVQGDFYNDDVDKVIALDSPHEGTGSLNLLLDMDNLSLRAYKAVGNVILLSAFWLGISEDISNIKAALYGLATSSLFAGVDYGVGQAILSGLKGFDYKPDDPLVDYIDINSNNSNYGVKRLQKLQYRESLPMMRLLGGKNSMTFTDPNEGWRQPFSFFIPNGLTAAFANAFTHISGNETSAANLVNSMTGFTVGLFGGVTVQEHGTALVPEASGLAKSTDALNDFRADVRRVQYDAAINANEKDGILSTAANLAILASSIFAVDIAMHYLFPNEAKVIKIALGVTGAAMLGQSLILPITVGVEDLKLSHKAPTLSKHQSDWFADTNTYSKISGGDTTIIPYRMEEFLYEKPFVNLRVHSILDSTWKDLNKDTLGLFGYDSSGNEVSLGVAVDFSKSSPLDFKSSSHWETFGAKKVRWDNNAQDADNNKIPIRHADRYAMPSIMVDKFIEKYEFEVDDLMPHRLRQIRINFNFNEDIAWECNVNKSETDNKACVVYKRTPNSNGWKAVDTTAHPVDKNGLFIFKPRDYYDSTGLGAIQKDNQNTVTITTVNKIGLTNSQRFYYMFKATADLLEPAWPYRNIKVSRIENFTAYVSTLAYTNTSVIGGKECVMLDDREAEFCLPQHKLSGPFLYGNGHLLKSQYNYGNLTEEKKYIWKLEINTGDTSDASKKSMSDMIVPFILDRTAPVIKLAAEKDVINSDSALILARFETNETLKFAAFFLKNMAGTTIAVAKYSDIIALNFGLRLSEFKDISTYKDLANLPDGKYEIVAYAFDGSVASKVQYEMLGKVARGDTSVSELFNNGAVKYDGMNVGKSTAAVIVDSHAPEFEIALSGLVMNRDSLLKVRLNVSDINGKAAAAVARFSILFADTSGNDTLRMGDTLLLNKNGVGSKVWEERGAGGLIPDGDYEVFINVWDEAGNMLQKKYGGILRIDRMPPTIIGVHSVQMAYRDSTGNYAAELQVEQHDKKIHLSEMHCSYRINGGEWQSIPEALEKKSERQGLNFKMDKNIVGNVSGLKYLEAGCRDWAGNFASALDIFFVGVPLPAITYPVDTLSSDSVIVVRGVAPKSSSSDLLASYMLEWRKEGDAIWQTKGVDVGYEKRYSASVPYMSYRVQSSAGDLGFLDMENLRTGTYELRLSLRDCDTCEWQSNSSSFYYVAPLNINTSKDSLLFAVSADSFDLEKNSMLSLSLKIKGATNTDYRVILYGRDSKDNALFEKSADSLSVAPYYGRPAAFEKNGVWFWSEKENVYNLRWKGLPEGKNIAVHYAKGDIDESVCAAACSKKDTLLASNEEIYAQMQALGYRFPYEVRTPKGLNRAMLFSGDSGAIQFSSKNPIWLRLFKDITDKDTTFLVHLGKGGSTQEFMTSFLGGFQVNPDFYGLYYEWNGISSTGHYPQGDTAYFYAEAVENMAGGRVLRDSIKVKIKKPALAIKAPEIALDDFNVVTDKGDTTILGNKIAYYGILWRDAKVSAYVKKADGTLVKTLFEDKPHAASTSEKAFMLSWNGIDKDNHLVIAEGNYYFEIVATESDASGTSQTSTLRLDFRISFAPGVKYVDDDPKRPSFISLVYADSVDKDYWQYTPVPDYLVRANASGKTLPDSLRNINVKWDANGTQEVQGYPPQRFSLAVKRQRQELPLVIVVKVNFLLAQQKCDVNNNSIVDDYFDTVYVHKVTFNEKKITQNLSFFYDAAERHKVGRGFRDEISTNKITLYAFTLNNNTENKAGEYLIYNEKPIWRKEIFLPKVNNDHIYDKDTISKPGKKDKSCTPSDPSDGSSGNICTDKDYDSNSNLFDVKIKPVMESFYYGWAEIHSHCPIYSAKGFRKFDANIELTIPDKDYWNIEYGYDNLVNRTIRLDQTNTTMYGGDGYLKQVREKTDIKTFFDGKDWKQNDTYGMLTPFEEHRFPFVSVNQISRNNAFTFQDEDDTHQYSSYYHATFFNQKDNNIQFNANIKGQYVIGKTCIKETPWGTCSGYSYEYAYDSLTTLSSNKADTVKTKPFMHGTVDIYVSMNKFDGDKVKISYPASENWADSLNSVYKCPGENCKKFYKDEANYGETINCSTSLKLESINYNSTRNEFFHKTKCTPPVSSNLKIKYTPKIKNTSDTSLYSFSGDTLYIKASDWNGVSVLRSRDSVYGWKRYPKFDSSITLYSEKFFDSTWIRKFKLDSARALLLDGNNHTHFIAQTVDSGIKLSAKDVADSLRRPAELIAIKGLIPENSNWKLSYVNLGNLQKLASGKSAGSLQEWFNVNRLQGNTSILLQWGGEGSWLNIRKLDLDIGAKVDSKSNSYGSIVSSLFGEVSVNFPPGSIRDSSNNPIDTIVTVRTANASDYSYKTSTGSALLGPVIEVLPSMKFSAANGLPRIKARIAKGELNGISPDKVRLYKVDTKNGKFMELYSTRIGFVDDKEPACNPITTIYDECGGYNESWTHLIISAETESFSAFAILDMDVAKELNTDPVVEPDSIPSQIICSTPPDTLWLGLDNGYLEMSQWCNQPAMGILQLRQGSNIVTEVRQNTADSLRWDGRTGVNKIIHGSYASRYIAIGTTGQEMQTLGPSIYTDTLRPVISNWNVQESISIIDREFRIQANVQDEFSGIGSIRLNWSLSEAISGTVYLNPPTNTNDINYTLYIPRKQLAQCVGCKLKISLRAEDKGHNWTEQEWQSGRLWPYPTELALWYPAQEGGGKTAREYIGTGHDLDLLMPNPWLSASGIYFDSTDKKAAGKGQVDLGRTNSYTLEAWVRPGYVSATPSWHRILGLRLANGRHVDLQIKGGDVRLLDGIQAWAVPELLSQPKAWSHLAIAVDGNNARFYLDGKPAGTIAAVPSERVWFGSLSLGTDDNAPSFIGHLMQVRLYKKALAEEEVYALFSGAGLGDDGSRVEITLAGDLNWKVDGVGREFSCAVPGSSYWETSKESTLSWKAWVERAALYRVFLYARSAQPGNKIVKAGVSGALVSGTASLENVWRSLALQEMALPLKAGFNDIELRFPAGMDIAGIAVSDNSGLLPSQISWKAESSVASSSTLDAQVRFEGQADPSMLRPRIRLQNMGSSTIYGPKVRYYFRGEDPAQVQASKFYPQEGTLAVRQEGYNLGYAEWSFPETTVLPSGQLLFWGEGPHFGLNNANYVPWVAKDDPGIVVLDADNRLLSGSCFENEQPLNTTPVLQVMARDSRFGDSQASQLYIKLENIGQVPVRDYEVRYSFYVPGNEVPVLDVYDMQGLSASLRNLGSGRWQVAISGTASLGPGISWANPAQFALHLPNWQTGWNAGDDPSHEGISAEWMLAKGIEVFDASGNRIYGKEPVWPLEISGQDNLIWGAELMAPSVANNSGIGITRLPDGLLITLLENSQLRLDLVNAAGMPQKFLYQGTLGAGEHIIPVNWSNIDFAKTYLVARINGKITTQLISTLRN